MLATVRPDLRIHVLELAVRHRRSRRRRPSSYPLWPLWLLALVFSIGFDYSAVSALRDLGIWALAGLFKRTPELSYTPPVYTPGSVYNGVIRLGEEAEAAKMAPSSKPFEFTRLWNQVYELDWRIRNLHLELGELWEWEMPNATVQAHQEDLNVLAVDFMRSVGEPMGFLDLRITGFLESSSQRINDTCIWAAESLKMPPDDFVALSKPRQPEPVLPQWLARWLVPSAVDSTIERERMLWDKICLLQGYLLRLDQRLLRDIDGVREKLDAYDRRLNPRTAFLLEEVKARYKENDTTVAQIAAYDEQVKQWAESTMSTWRNSSWALRRFTGYLLGGKHPPSWPHWELHQTAGQLDRLESMRGRLDLIRAYSSSLHRFVSSAALRIRALEVNRAERHLDESPWTCSALPHIASSPSNHSKPHAEASAYGMLLFLQRTAWDFSEQMRQWDRADFKDIGVTSCR
ncbi:putative Coatomer subunit alpha [Lasiodiplodia theobromae]|uniref:putative Coatomer subunit alpha n=1 Tax=Lasiodiplodia theobromae TaxID=45133 RepID=UPI0015C3BD77|nr:putative Coatomer subunit alpha [Lasiodiplodia theobromae]KAF4537856.1 putative Coatomer subunit alpha [Lasiodiplodia theobromae]